MKIGVGNLVIYLNNECEVVGINKDGSLELSDSLNNRYNNVHCDEVTIIPFVDNFKVGDEIVNTKGVHGTIKGIAGCIYYIEFQNGEFAYYICDGQVNERISDFVTYNEKIFLNK